MVVVVNYLRLCQECCSACFGSVIVSRVHFGAVFHSGNMLSYADDSTLTAVLPSSGIRVTVAEPLIRDLGWVNEWYDFGE